MNDEEKLNAMKVYATLELYSQIIEESKDLGYDELAKDLEREYYPIMDRIYSILKQTNLKGAI